MWIYSEQDFCLFPILMKEIMRTRNTGENLIIFSYGSGKALIAPMIHAVFWKFILTEQGMASIRYKYVLKSPDALMRLEKSGAFGIGNSLCIGESVSRKNRGGLGIRSRSWKKGSLSP